MKPIRKKGFAIVLVAALAGLIFLLGASLVVVSRLQTASANYDQRVRLARDHARAALDMAVAELQEHLGKDTSVSFSADTMSQANTQDFKETGRVGAVRQPFWMGASSGGGSVHWFVTRAMDGSIASPKGTFNDPEIEVVGEGTVGSNALLNVKVPIEAIRVTRVDGFAATDSKTIGNYGYWIGDLGVKASYALYDGLEDVSHDVYSEFYVMDPNPDVPGDEFNFYDKRVRLRQMTPVKPSIDFVDTNEGSVSPANPDRIDLLVNDLQFRERFGDSGSLERYLFGLSEGEVETYFQDFTPLSRGLLVNSKSGGFRFDLSSGAPSGDAEYNEGYSAYRNLAVENKSTAHLYDDHSFPTQISGIPIRPVLTQFNLNYSVSLTGETEDPKMLSVAFEATAELWNPYSSAIDFEGDTLILEVEGLPELLVWVDESAEADPPDARVDLMSGTAAVEFEIDKFQSVSMRPGEIVVVAGPLGGSLVAPYAMGEGSISRAQAHSAEVGFSGVEVASFDLSFDAPATLTVRLWRKLEDGTKTYLADYGFPGSLVLAKTNFGSIADAGIPRFGFSWEVSDSAIFPLVDYHPFIVRLNSDSVEGWSSDASHTSHLSTDFEPAGDDVLLGYNPTSGGSLNKKYDIPVFFLPKQELLNVGSFSLPSESDQHESALGGKLQSGVKNENRFFDQYFFSSLPVDVSSWGNANRIPNTFYKPRMGTTVDMIVAGGNAPAEDLFVHGMFNVHSTSIDAWASLLKGAPTAAHSHWKNVFPVGTYLFMNHPSGGEDVFSPVPDTEPTVGSAEAKRLSFKKNAFALTDSQVETLAGLIVKEIREYVGGEDGVMNPFDSLEEFVNSGVLQNAVDALDQHADLALRINPSWVIEGTPGEFRQSTILNLISGILSVRSDTFLVRAYGDAVDPANPSKVWARAYCEAIVQRTHEQYGDIVPESAADKKALDRKFEVVAFRWLAPSEI